MGPSDGWVQSVFGGHLRIVLFERRGCATQEFAEAFLRSCGRTMQKGTA